MKLSRDTANLQHNLAHYCRTGKDTPLAGITPNRIHHYRRLVFNVIKNTLTQAFPITVNYMGTKKWEGLVADFFENHDCQTPQVWKLPYEFYLFSRENNYHDKYSIPFLNDLLYFEWIEIEVYTMPDAEHEKFVAKGDYLTDPLVFNPEYRIIKLQYPVHKYRPEQAKNKPGEYFVLAFREPESGKVKFMNLSLFHVYLIERLHEYGYKMPVILNEAMKIFKIKDKELLLVNVQKFFSDIQRESFLLGFGIEN